MSRSAAARADHDHDRVPRAPRARAPALPRRMSGPAHPSAHTSDGALVPRARPLPRPRTPSRPPLRLAAGGASIALRIADAALEVSASRTMDRLVRSRAWVVIIGFGLIGIVAMQVSMLKLNNGIGRAVETAARLERGSASLRAEISRLSSGTRIQALAGSRGFVMPEPADVTYLKAGTLSSDGLRAAQRMRAPNPDIVGTAGLMTTGSTVTSIPAEGGSSAPAETAALPAGVTAPAPATAAPPHAAATGAAQATPAAPATAGPATAPTGGVTVP